VAARVQGGRARAAVDAGRAALALSREIGNRQGEVLAGFVLTVALTEVGEYGAALDLAERSVEVARAIGVPTARLTSLMGLGLARRAALALEGAERALLEAHAVAVALASRPQVEMVAGSLCTTHALQGDWPRAFGRAEHELGLRNYDWLPPATTPRWLVTEALLRGGAPERAAEDLRQLDEYASVNQRSVVPYLMAKSVLYEWSGENDAALELLLEARNSHGALVPGEAWHLHSAVARLRAALGDAEGAASERRAAYAVTERLAASIGDAATRAHFTSRAAAIIGDP
jgi:hypothetical protein